MEEWFLPVVNPPKQKHLLRLDLYTQNYKLDVKSDKNVADISRA